MADKKSTRDADVVIGVFVLRLIRRDVSTYHTHTHYNTHSKH